VIPRFARKGLTDHGEFPILVTGGNDVERSYQDIMAERRGRLAPESAAVGEVFARSYDIAMQIIELRESRGLTQSELGPGRHQPHRERLHESHSENPAANRRRTPIRSSARSEGAVKIRAVIAGALSMLALS